MLRSIKDLTNYPIEGRESSLGRVKDFLFDDRQWRIRYLVVDTGSWLTGRKVLVSPEHLEPPREGGSVDSFRTTLTRESIEKGPLLDEHAPVSRRYEKEHARYYRHHPYWEALPPDWDTSRKDGLGGSLGKISSPAPSEEEFNEHERRIRKIDECHVRSSREVTGYTIRASDGDFGHVEDLIVDTQVWRIRHLIIATRNWLPGRMVLTDIDWIEKIDWAAGKAAIDLTKDQIKDSPEFDPSAPVNREYEEHLYDYYGRQRYWK
jgi:sporulation protein YlmC with PRC-barrel domain